MGVCRLRIGIFVASDGAFQTIAAPDPDVFVEEPVLNDAGVVAFYRSVIQDGNQVFELVAIGDSGALTLIADTNVTSPRSGSGHPR